MWFGKQKIYLFLTWVCRFGTGEHFNCQDFLLLELICKAPPKYADYFDNDDLVFFFIVLWIEIVLHLNGWYVIVY